MIGIDISICVAAYNIEDYIERCLYSIQQACLGYENRVEVIIIDDGSTDTTLAKIQEFTKNLSNVRVITQANQGLSEVRNRSFREACGEYIWCVDGDDTISSEAIFHLLRFIDTHANVHTELDMIVFNSIELEEKQQYKVYLQNTYPLLSDFKSGKVFNFTDRPEIIFALHATWSRIIRRSIFDKLLWGFVPALLHEDFESTPRILAHVNSVGFLDEHLYIHHYRPGAITQGPIKKRGAHLIQGMNSIKKYYVEQGIYDKYRQLLECYFFIYLGSATAIVYRECGECVEYRKISDNITKDFINIANNKYFKILPIKSRLQGQALIRRWIEYRWYQYAYRFYTYLK